MFKQWKRFTDYLGWLTGSAAPRRQPYRARPRVEVLEERWCPAGTWQWVGGPPGVMNNWSNANGGLWTLNGAPTGPGLYPGMVGSIGDDVRLGGAGTGSCEMDVILPNFPKLLPLQSLEIQNWNQNLYLDGDVTLTGVQGDFKLADGSAIILKNNAHLILIDLNLPQNTTANLWTNGAIRAFNSPFSSLDVQGSTLAIQQSPSKLGVSLDIKKSSPAGNLGYVTLSSMTGNLTTDGLPDQIIIEDGGTLALNQQIALGRQNLDGGIAAANNSVFVLVDTGGSLIRSSNPIPGVPDQVMIAGGISNSNALVSLAEGNMLNLTGTNMGHGSSYGQTGLTNPLLDVSRDASLIAAGTIQIDTGTVDLNTGVANALTSTGLIFGANNTFFTVNDWVLGTTGQVSVSGPVTLAANTTLTLNFSGANNKADLLTVTNGTLQLGGMLKLNCIDAQPQKPGIPLKFLADGGNPPFILQAFTTITSNVPGNPTYTPGVDDTNPAMFYYKMTIA